METTQTNAKGMHISLWVAQVLLAAMYLMAGGNKLFQPIAGLAAMLPWVTEMPAAIVRFIGLSELLGGFGLLLPALLRVKPVLTPLAAAGLAVVQLLAMFFHLSRGENAAIGINAVLILLALFIVWGRTKKAPIAAR